MTAVTEVMALAVVAGVVVLLARFLGYYLHFRKLELAIPGPPSLFLLGNALDMVSATEDTTMKTFLRLIGGRREMCRFTVLNQIFVAVQDPEQIDEVVRCKKFDDKPSIFYSFLKVGAEKGLVQLNGPEWKAHRKWLEPGFHVQVLNRFEHIFREEAQAYVDRVEVDKEVDVVENLRKASVRNFLRTSMEDSSGYEDIGMECTGFLEMFLHSVSSRTFNPILWSDRVFKMTPLGKKVVKTVQATRNISATFIAKKRAEIEKHQNDCDFDRARKTLMDIMLDPNTVSQAIFKEDAITDELITFFGANVETTVSTLTWALKVLSLLPEVQERVYAELTSVVGDSDVSIEHLPKLEYLNRVIKESMRMFPTIPFVARQCYKETKVCGHTIPAGAAVLINMFGAHYDPKHWDKPEVFDPDRFLPERSKDRHPCAYMPFSAGPRKCIGGKYAMMNMTMFLAILMRAFILQPTDDHKDLKSLANNMTFDLSSHLVGGTRVKFHRRRGKAA